MMHTSCIHDACCMGMHDAFMVHASCMYVNECMMHECMMPTKCVYNVRYMYDVDLANQHRITCYYLNVFSMRCKVVML